MMISSVSTELPPSHSLTFCPWKVAKQITTLTLLSRLFPPPQTSSTEVFFWRVQEVIITSKIIRRGPPPIMTSLRNPFIVPHCTLHQHHNIIASASHQHTFPPHSLHPSYTYSLQTNLSLGVKHCPFPNKQPLASFAFYSFSSSTNDLALVHDTNVFFFQGWSLLLLLLLLYSSQGILKDDRPFTSPTVVTRDLR